MNDLVTDIRRRLDGTIEVLQRDFAGLVDLLDVMKGLASVKVAAYNNNFYLRECASARKSETEVRFSVFDKTMIVPVQKAIRDSGMGLSPYAEGNTVVVPIPPVTKERLAEVARVAAKYAAQAKDAVLRIKADAMYATAKQAAGEEERREMENKIETMINECLGRIENMLKDREDVFLMRL
jgi:ribosome recycling factor